MHLAFADTAKSSLRLNASKAYINSVREIRCSEEESLGRTRRREARRSIPPFPLVLLTLEDPQRFRKSRDVGCYLGLQPGRRNSV